MFGASSPSSKSLVCPFCGLTQEESREECSRCGHALHPPGLIYRREADGTWSIIRDIDLSSLAPKPPPVRRKLISRQGAAVMLALILPGAALDIWLWQVSARAARMQSDEIVRYLDHPVGRIVPRFELHYQRGEGGNLWVSGQSNLPDGTALEVQVYAGDVLVAVDYPVTVSGGEFETRPLLQRGKPFTLATYRVRIRGAFEKDRQPPSALLVVGGLGERLKGSLVRRSDASSGAKLEFAEEFVLNQ
jgi:hypothetical protein